MNGGADATMKNPGGGKLSRMAVAAFLALAACSCVSRRPGEPSLPPTDSTDLIPPAAITSLQVSDVTDHSITLRWVAPGDDSTEGKAQSYDLRYSFSPIHDANWESTTSVVGIQDPDSAGSRESHEVKGLDPDTTYYFAIKTVDDSGNVSVLSNNAVASTELFSLDMAEFPLAVGARWRYAIQLEEPPFGISLTDTIEVQITQPAGDLEDGGVLVWKVDDPRTGTPAEVMSGVLGDTLQFTPDTDDPVLFRRLIFPLRVGSTWESQLPIGGNFTEVDTVQALESVPLGPPVGLLKHVLRIDRHTNVINCTTRRTYWIAPDIGLVKMTGRATGHACTWTFSWELIDFDIPPPTK